MRKYLWFVIGSGLGWWTGIPEDNPDKYASCKSVDVVIQKGMNKTIYKDVKIQDEQEEFCMFVHNGVSRIEKAPYEIVCNK